MRHMHGCWCNSGASFSWLVMKRMKHRFGFCWSFTEMMNLQTSEEPVSFGIHVSARLALVLFSLPPPPSRWCSSFQRSASVRSRSMRLNTRLPAGGTIQAADP